jgi:hypothetical protein
MRRNPSRCAVEVVASLGATGIVNEISTVLRIRTQSDAAYPPGKKRKTFIGHAAPAGPQFLNRQ